MNKRNNGFSVFEVLLALVVIGALFGSFFFVKNKISPSYAACPQAKSGIFTSPLMDMSSLKAIQIAGGTNGVDHILPRDHSDFYLNDGTLATSPKTSVYAPANLTINKISKHTDYDSSGKAYTNSTNYILDTTVCKDLHFWIEWLHELSPQLATVFDNAKKKHDEGALNAGAKGVNDSVNVNIKLNAGDMLGTAGGARKDDGFSIAIYDYNLKARTDVNWDYYKGMSTYERRYYTCFTDYYADPLQSQYNAKFGHYEYRGSEVVFMPSNAEPKCGSIMQNIVGTIQGDWFAGDPPKTQSNPLQSQGKTLSFIHYYNDWTKGVISIGGTLFNQPATYIFNMTHSGNINRDFSETKVGQAYCYQLDPGAPSMIVQSPTGSVVVKLVDEHNLKISHQDSACAETSSLSGQAIDYKR